MSEALAILQRVRALLAQGWTQRATARCQYEKPCHPLSSRAVAWSLDGAIVRAVAETGRFSPIHIDAGKPDYISFASHRWAEWSPDDEARADAFDAVRGQVCWCFGVGFDFEGFNDARTTVRGNVVRVVERAMREAAR